MPESILDALRDDLNTPRAIAALNALAKKAMTDDTAKKQLKAAANLFGLLEQNDWFTAAGDDNAISEDMIEKLIDERAEVKENKNFARADEIRNMLEEQGVFLLDGPDGTTWERK